MKKTKKTIDLTDEVMKEIHENHIKMRPKFYFVAGSVLLGFGLAGTVIMATIFTNIVVFRLRYYDAFGYLEFGKSGFQPFITTFPWAPFIVAIFGLVGGLLLLRRFDLSYKRKFSALIIALIIIVLAIGSILDYAGATDKVRHMKHMESLYEYEMERVPWVVGRVIQVEDRMLVIITPYKEQIIITAEKQAMSFKEFIKEDDAIRALGEWNEDVFVAEQIIKTRMQRQIDINDVKGMHRRVTIQRIN